MFILYRTWLVEVRWNITYLLRYFHMYFIHDVSITVMVISTIVKMTYRYERIYKIALSWCDDTSNICWQYIIVCCIMYCLFICMSTVSLHCLLFGSTLWAHYLELRMLYIVGYTLAACIRACNFYVSHFSIPFYWVINICIWVIYLCKESN